MFDTIRALVPTIVLAWVLAVMLHVGLTQAPRRILGYLREWPFIMKMVIANFVAAPLLMYVILRLTSFEPALDAGLLLLGLCAGAPFLIKLTQKAEHDLALGAFTMMLLMVLTVPFVPLVLPRIIEGMAVDAWAIAKTLLLQLLLPIGAGMLTAQFLPGVAQRIEPFAAKLGNITLYAMIIATVVGYWPNFRDIIGNGATLAGIAFVAGAFGLGYIAGWGADRHEDVGALGTAQRNTAAGLIIATQNFEDPNVLVIMTLVSTLGMVLLLFVAAALTRDNRPRIVNV